MEYLLTLLYTLVFIVILWKIPFFRAEGLSRKTTSIIFIIKILAGIAMSLIYIYYYTDRRTADIFKYFDDSKVMYDALYKKPLDFFSMMTGIGNNSAYFDAHYYKVMNNWYRVYESNIYNESHTIIRFNALIRIFSFGYYNVHTVFICFLSLTGLVALYKIAISFILNKSKELIFGIFLLPSVIFWGSGVMKEGLLFFGLGMLVYHFIKLLEKFNLKSLLWIMFSVALIYFTKFYVLAIIIPVMIAYLWVNKTNNKYILLKYITVFVLYIIAGLLIKRISPAFDAIDILVTKQRDFIGLARSLNSGSLINIPVLTPDIWSFIKHAPQAFFITMFRPFIMESNSILTLMAALENFIILIVLALAIIFFSRRQINFNIFYACLFGVICMFILTGLITPVMGAMVRYKVPALPFLMVLLIMMIDKEKMIKRIPFLKFLNK
ncbi:MAG: hypothetical protein ABR968_06260 [Bacteroidales bacterium]